METQTLFLRNFVREIIHLSTPLEITLKKEREEKKFTPLPKPKLKSRL
jgi:hypothetical protein